MILNLRPSNAEFLEPVIEEADGRFGGGGTERGPGGEDGGGDENENENRNGNGNGNVNVNGKKGIEDILEVVRSCMGGGEDGSTGGAETGDGDRDERMEGVEV